jgi:hypothetical protein
MGWHDAAATNDTVFSVPHFSRAAVAAPLADRTGCCAANMQLASPVVAFTARLRSESRDSVISRLRRP